MNSNVGNSNLEAFLGAVRTSLGVDSVDCSAERLERYGENTLPTGDSRPAAVLYPASTADVQAVVKLANRHNIHLWPVSTGNNQGLGTRSPVRPGQVVVDLGRRMNRILEIDETLCFAQIEPGVSYQRMYDELSRRGNRHMLDTTSGPPEGGILGNTLDKGAGYTPYFDHFYMSCGMEVVLGNGTIIRTGDGALKNAKAWNISKYSFGPEFSGLFLQSNFGIVTRMGFWLMPRPPVIQSFHFSFPDDDDIAEIIELCRPVKITGFVPTLFRICNDVYLFGTEESHPEYSNSGGKVCLSDAGRRELQKKHGIGSWVVSGAFYGASTDAIEPNMRRIREHFLKSGKATYINHEQAEQMPPLNVAVCAFSGVPTTTELGLLKWRPGGGNTWILPGMPMTGDVARRHHNLSRGILNDHGLEYCVMIVGGARFARELIVISFNREDEEECRRADAAYRRLGKAFAEEGFSVGRAPTGYQSFHMGLLDPAFVETCRSIKRALDPNGVIAPGKYGIMP